MQHQIAVVLKAVHHSTPQHLYTGRNSLHAERSNFKCVNFEHNLGFDILSTQVNITLEWMPEHIVNDESILGPMTVLCHQTSSHYLVERSPSPPLPYAVNGPLARYLKLRVAHALGMPGTFFPPPQVNDPDMHHGTCVTHVLVMHAGIVN